MTRTKTNSGQKITQTVDLAGDSQGWARLTNSMLSAINAPRQDPEPSPLAVFGDPEGEAQTQRELEARAAVRQEQGATAYDIFGGD